MDYEKKYKEALEKAKKHYKETPNNVYKAMLEQIFPDLKESEDEKIRKALIRAFKSLNTIKVWNGIERTDIIAWLKKQKPIQNINKEDEKIKKEIINYFNKGKEYLSLCSFSKEDILAWLEKQNSNVDNANKEYWRGYREGKQEILDKYAENEQNPYSGVSFKYNGHIWGMCARDNGVDILLDKQLFKHLEKQGEQKFPIEKLPEEMKSVGESLGFTTQKECDEYNKMVSELIMSDDDKIEPKFKVGDTMRTLQEASDGYTDGMPVVVSIDNEYYRCTNELIAIKDQDDYEFPPINVKQKPVVIIPKFRVGDIIRHKKYGFTCKIIAVDTEYRLSECMGIHLPFESQDAYELVEKELVDEVKPKFKVGNWIVNNVSKDIFLIKSFNSGYCSLEDTKGDIYSPCLPFESNFHLWTIKDARPGNVLATDKSVFIYSKVLNSKPYAYCGVDKYGVFKDNCLENNWTNSVNNIHPATKEQRDLLFAKMKEAGYEWLEETKELKKIELSDVGHEYYSELLKNDKSDTIGDYAYQCAYCMSHDWAIENPTWDNVQSACKLGAKWQKKHDVSEDWSKEDEKILKDILVDVKFEGYNNDMLANSYKKINWLKSLKERFKIQTRQGISKEDEYSFMMISGSIRQDQDLSPEDKNKLRLWLKSIIYQSHWKPSDEQMTALHDLNLTGNISYAGQGQVLIEFYNDLKKLKE